MIYQVTVFFFPTWDLHVQMNFIKISFSTINKINNTDFFQLGSPRL
jgi:hypothetical protein